MKLYYTGNANGELKYSLDGGSTYIATTLRALKEGIELPEDQDFSKVKVKASSNVFSSLEVVKKINASTKAQNIHLVDSDPTSNNNIHNERFYFIDLEDDNGNYTDTTINSYSPHLVFKNHENGKYYRYLVLADYLNWSLDDFDVVLVFSSNEDYYEEGSNYGTSHQYTNDDGYEDTYYTYDEDDFMIFRSYWNGSGYSKDFGEDIKEIASFGPASQYL